jgi:hypothetical protein
MFGDCFYFETPVKTSLESNMSKTVFKIGQLAFWTAQSAIVIPYGRTPFSTDDDENPRLLEECNVWAEVDLKEYNLPQIYRSLSLSNSKVITIEKWYGQE